MAYDGKRLFAQIEHYLSRQNDWRLKTLAQEFHVDRRAIEKAVLLSKGCSFREYRKLKRMEHFNTLVQLRGDLSLKQIASSLGFRTAAAFSRFVRQMTGQTPSRQRNGY